MYSAFNFQNATLTRIYTPLLLTSDGTLKMLQGRCEQERRVWLGILSIQNIECRNEWYLLKST